LSVLVILQNISNWVFYVHLTDVLLFQVLFMLIHSYYFAIFLISQHYSYIWNFKCDCTRRG